MSVAATTEARLIYFPTHDQRLPVGMWYGMSDIVGDASGGTASLQVRRAELTDLRRFWHAYSVEAAWYQALDNAGCTLTTIWTPPTSMPDWAAWTLSRTEAAVAGSDSYYRHYFSAQVPVLPSYNLNVTLQQVNAASTKTAGAWGYLWRKEAFALPGGPTRPFAAAGSAGGASVGGP